MINDKSKFFISNGEVLWLVQCNKDGLSMRK